MDFSYNYMEEVKDITTLHYDLFISAFDGCERTTATYERITAENKYGLYFRSMSKKKMSCRIVL